MKISSKNRISNVAYSWLPVLVKGENNDDDDDDDDDNNNGVNPSCRYNQTMLAIKYRTSEMHFQ